MPELDSLLGGLIPGDNIVWVSTDARMLDLLEHAFLAQQPRSAAPLSYVSGVGTLPDGVRALRPLITHA